VGRPVRNIAGTRVKVCLAQINTTPGDFEGNLQRIRTGVDAATAGGAHLVVFPELTIPGYLTQDLIYHPAYVARNLAVLDEVKAMTIDTPCAVVVGFIDHNPGPGKPFRNCAAVFRGGDEVARYSKHLLPFYDVFDELRYFEPGTELAVIDVAGERVGIVICEDLWNDKGSDGYDYAANPMQRYRDQGVDCVVSLNSSPYSTDKPVDRIRRIAPTSVGGPDVVYSFQAATGQSINIEVNAEFDRLIYVFMGECGLGAILSCANEDLFIQAQAGGEYWLVIDGAGPGQWGSYDLTVTLQ